MAESPGSLAPLLAAAAARLTAAGIEDSRREARRLWTDLLPTVEHNAILLNDGVVSSDTAARYHAAVERRAAGEPLAYVTGWTGFRHLTLRCDRRALIPRPETEGLVDVALARVRIGRAADIGTGTGAIALSLVREGEYASVIGIDLSAAALELAAVNGAATGLSVDWRFGDLLAPLAGEQVDLLVSNPPYLTLAEYAEVDRSVRDYEPALALPSGKDGLDATRRLLVDSRAVVAPGGWIAIEVDSRRGAASAGIAGDAGWQEVTVLDDLFGRARYLLARQGNIG